MWVDFEDVVFSEVSPSWRTGPVGVHSREGPGAVKPREAGRGSVTARVGGRVWCRVAGRPLKVGSPVGESRGAVGMKPWLS